MWIYGCHQTEGKIPASTAVILERDEAFKNIDSHSGRTVDDVHCQA